ncbi:MAG: phosphotransferase family protein [Spirosomataceae bacterium]
MNQPNQIRPGEELPISLLSDYFIQQGLTSSPIISYAQFPGGYSNLTYQLEMKEGLWILRKGPKGAEKIKRGHDMIREANVLNQLHAAGFTQVPRVIHVCDLPEILGSPFYLMQRVEGMIYRAGFRSIPPPSTMRLLSERLGDTLVKLHSLDLQSTGLISLGKPEGFMERQVDGWTHRFEVAQTEPLESMEILSAWLKNHIPPPQKPVLLHNDFKYDNVIFGQDFQVNAVLDWEMATVGEPLLDVGVALSYWSQTTDSDFEKAFNITWWPGNFSRSEWAQYYADRSGRDIQHLPYYYAFGLFKNAVVMQQIFARYQAGLTTDPRFASLGAGVRQFSERGIQVLEKGRID